MGTTMKNVNIVVRFTDGETSETLMPVSGPDMPWESDFGELFDHAYGLQARDWYEAHPFDLAPGVTLEDILPDIQLDETGEYAECVRLKDLWRTRAFNAFLIVATNIKYVRSVRLTLEMEDTGE